MIFDKLENNSKEIDTMKKELNNHKRYIELKTEVRFLKDMMLNKKGSAFTTFLMFLFLLVLIYALFIALGVVKI